MDVPILTAVTQKRREEAEFRIGCRLISWELEEIRVIMGIVQSTKSSWSPTDLELTMETWEKHQHVLASYLSDEAWHHVWKAVLSARFCRMMLANARGGPYEMSDGEAKAVAGLVADIVKARTSLQAYLRKPRRRLLKPLRIGPTVPGPSISG